VLTVTLTFQPKTIPLVGYLKVIPCTNFKHFGIIRFFSYAPDISLKNTLTDPVTLTFEPQNHPGIISFI